MHDAAGCHLASEFPAVAIHAANPQGIVLAHPAVRHVLRVGTNAQVFAAIVQWVAIDVIDLKVFWRANNEPVKQLALGRPEITTGEGMPVARHSNRRVTLINDCRGITIRRPHKEVGHGRLRIKSPANFSEATREPMAERRDGRLCVREGEIGGTASRGREPRPDWTRRKTWRTSCGPVVISGGPLGQHAFVGLQLPAGQMLKLCLTQMRDRFPASNRRGLDAQRLCQRGLASEVFEGLLEGHRWE